MPKSTSKKDFTPIEYDAKRDALARDRLIQARVAMLIRHDFWGKMATRMRLINADAWCPTLATDGRDFYYNSDFVLSLGSIDKVIFGFAHEVLHCIYDHIPRTGDRDRKLSNIAQDYGSRCPFGRRWKCRQASGVSGECCDRLHPSDGTRG